MTVEEQLAARLERQARDLRQQVRERGNLSKKGSPSRPSHANEIKIREGMTCGSRFVSEGVGNRLCTEHRKG
jgi:hypothetical protein